MSQRTRLTFWSGNRRFLSPFRLDRDSTVTGKSLGGSLCLSIKPGATRCSLSRHCAPPTLNFCWYRYDPFIYTKGIPTIICYACVYSPEGCCWQSNSGYGKNSATASRYCAGCNKLCYGGILITANHRGHPCVILISKSLVPHNLSNVWTFVTDLSRDLKNPLVCHSVRLITTLCIWFCPTNQSWRETSRNNVQFRFGRRSLSNVSRTVIIAQTGICLQMSVMTELTQTVSA